MWNSIIGQDKVIEKLKSIYSTGKIAHAYLFYGNEGVGKDAAAIEFAKLINCTNVKNEEACSVCDNCKKISAFRSEYFHFICALPSGKSEQTDSDPLEKLSAEDYESYLEQMQLKSQNPYHHVSIPDANNIRINSIRDMISRIYFTSGKNHRKVFLISEADKMKQEAANALLKVLEEPPKDSLIILTTSKINALPQTVIGRCQKIYFETLSAQQVKGMLSSSIKNGAEMIDETEIELASRLSAGSFTRASELINLGIQELREDTLNYLMALLRGNHLQTVSVIRAVTAKNNKERTRYFLYLLNIFFRDLMLMKYRSNDAENSGVANIDITDRLMKFNKNFPHTDVFSAIMNLEESEKELTQNVQLALILLDLSFKLKRAIKQPS